MLLDKPESHLGQILQELLLMELTGKRGKKGEKKKKKKLERGDTGTFPCIC